MSEIKPKKERRFLKTLGRVGEILVEQVLLKLGSSLIKKIGGKKTLPSILFLLASLSLFAQYPNTGNKQRLGFQTTGDGLVWRGALSDTASIQPINNQNAWVILDTVNLKLYSFDFTSNVWNLVGGGAAAFTQPVDSLFFNVNVPTNNVDTAKMRWDSDLATVVLGLNDNVPNELGFKNFWLVKNQTGATITKGSLVYANGTVGASGRITVAKFIANGSIDAKYLLGITAHDLSNGEDGYVISFGKIRQVNTDTFAAGAILYPSPTVTGVWTDVEPVAPNIDMPIGFCINSHVNNGTIAIRVASGYKLSELHDVSITSPVENSSLYYKGGLWRDTTAAILTSDTASMLLPYLRDADTVTLSNRINLKLNIADTSAFARDNQISGTSGQVAYFNSSSSVVSDTALRWSAANKSLGINMTSVPSGANLILKNSQEPVRTTIVANQTFGADTTNWTCGAGWTFNGTVAVATAATGALTYTPTLDLTAGDAYEISFTVTSYTSGTITPRVNNASYFSINNALTYIIVIVPSGVGGGFRFLTSNFTGQIDNVSVVKITKFTPVLLAGQDDNSTTLYSPIIMPNSTSLSIGGGGAITTGSNNLFFGREAGTYNTSGTENNFFGNKAGAYNTSGIRNNFFGLEAGYSNISGSKNNFFGFFSGYRNISGFENNFFGSQAGQNNIDGYRNNFFGTLSGGSNTFGINNNFFGYQSGFSNTTGSNNNFFGDQSGLNNTTGSNNNFFGRTAGVGNTVGLHNTAIGTSALNINTIGSNNIGIGQLSGRIIRRGEQNIAIGFNSFGNATIADTVTGSNNLAIGTNAADNIAGAAAGNVAIGNAVDLPTNNGSNQGVYQNVLFFTGASGTGTTIAAASKAGIKTNAPNRDLEVAGEVRITDLTTDAPTRLVGADADGDLGQVTLGAGLSLASSSLLADTNFLVTRFDTASMLTNYLRTGTAASTYFSGSGTTNYLPKFIGTLTLGNSVIQQSGNNIGINTTPFSSLTLGQGKNIMLDASSDNIPKILFYEAFDRNEDYVQFGAQIQYNSPTDRLEFKMRNNVDELAISILRESGNTIIHKDLTITGATTLSSPLTVNSSAVFNEAATDSDFRVESEANANMLFVDASTSRVGIGYASPTKTLDVNGEVRINTVTATPTSLLGKNGSNVVGEVTTVAQTGLMTRGETTATTGSPSATFTVTHGLGATPTSVLVTSAGLAGAEKIIFEVYTKSDTTFSVQAWNYDGTEASSKSVKIFWLAIK